MLSVKDIDSVVSELRKSEAGRVIEDSFVDLYVDGNSRLFYDGNQLFRVSNEDIYV